MNPNETQGAVNEEQKAASRAEETETGKDEIRAEESAAEEQASASADASEEQADSAETIAMKQEIERLQQELEESRGRLIRAQADFDNFRKRTRLEKEDFAKYASFKLIEQLLPVVDNFDRAIQTSRETRDFDGMLKGVEMTFRQLDQVLAQEGLAAMDAIGQPFDPDRHQAIMQVESDEYEEGIVVEEIQKGYMLKDKVLRPAMVKVSG
ncbi:nucleotide exchange factor GrpE [Paenibacillus sp. J31TS4]|uniref:nucleotide exchange factor GrpE n=1 Tax=Paenibacillus sp. J31TS4 TaxID=2807195 RepID=UPI001B13D367|nr:nucleotide exchange factor GrpE [Paenibacillus sp. J31TS4]GIP39581.1 nucleotide exchange factor GrpE [Paenibacillus sp. J31TS4]